MPEKKKLKTQVLIIGGGVTGTGLARDLSLRGISSIVLEMDMINSGASGRNHGLLHSGARYVSSDPISALECKKEGDILKKIAPHCIEETGGLYVATREDKEDYIDVFPALCKKAGIPCEKLSVKQVLELEPVLSPQTVAAFRVEDASVDPFHISLENMNQAIEHGARYYNHCKVTKFLIGSGTIEKVVAKDLLNKRIFEIQTQIVVNAAGAWSGEIAKLAGIHVDMIYSKGSLLITHNRISNHVINRLRLPSDGDILVPGGTVSIFGTTSLRIDTLETIRPTVQEIDSLVKEAKAMVPELENTRYIRAYAGVRPLINEQAFDRKESTDDRAVSRGFSLIDHKKDEVDNFITITGGKMTTFRLMAQKAADMVARKLENTQPCRTAVTPLTSGAPSQMTEAGMSFRLWAQKGEKEDITMCECELISKNQFKELISWLKKSRKTSDLNALRIHSRLGKGSCQGTFCSQRVTGFMYDENYLKEDEGIYNIKDLLHERFIGQRPVLWDGQLSQSELNEALYCGFYGLELEK
ncbi:MAG: anaerobic glycerol-3-phosphate dehydrogenase subunit A [Proteobacteria bacterium]|nr:anaerobic glycerol-3-phosphate dehydrogenase subunit A [Pseudomonadota bacterium]MBU1584634.1 anaerobic glycerol-3-phosphate dehydrogenase subunit A [Pseudomonadota bacterium]MBU2453635.1 anaerobic glycerol-3-phosphate dehydrogenase subunit A [Pseudomonadota bacterium]MBU2627251.1 anaerobic glycerol-3-phosphate dehydrogenase subunit A [Pseudomonadota bacterium]